MSLTAFHLCGSRPWETPGLDPSGLIYSGIWLIQLRYSQAARARGHNPGIQFNLNFSCAKFSLEPHVKIPIMF